MEEYKPDKYITEDQIELARYVKALSHPVRIYILKLLSRQSCCYSGDLAEILPIARSTLSQHLKELKRAGLIKGTTRPPRAIISVLAVVVAAHRKRVLITPYYLKITDN